MQTFAAATAVGPDGPGRWVGTIEAGWDIAGNANGGYLLAIGARALSGATGRHDPVSVTAHYLSPGKPGPVRLETTVVKEGKRFSTATATMTALTSERPVLTVLGSLGELVPSDALELVGGSPPELPPPEECVRLVATDTFPPPFMNHVDLRLHPDDAGFTGGGGVTGTPRLRGWFRLAADEPVDTMGLLCAVDAFPPTIFNTELPVAWVPTLELTAHVRGRPAPGWLRCRFSTRFVTGGFLEEDGEVWDSADRLVAQSRQLALVPRA